MSPEATERNQKYFERIPVNGQREPKVLYTYDDRYIEIANWKDVCCIDIIILYLKKCISR